MAIRSEVNIGQLARERHGNEHVYILGFGTGTGMVLAGSTWGSPVQTMRIPHPPLSYSRRTPARHGCR